jgi:hypothetical protein
MDDMSISTAIERVAAGMIRVPAFQRGFVWDAERVAYFMDSLYKEYPFGSLLLWRTREGLRTERKLGPFTLPATDPAYPIDYVLDGQQRLTSIFAVFQNIFEAEPTEGWLPIYYDFQAQADAQESQFFALPSTEVDPDRHFPLATLFVPAAYRAATRAMDEEIALQIDEMQKRFLQVKLPVQLFETDSREKVAIVFERVNRLGIDLDVLQLLTAWTWSEDFDLQESFVDLSEELAPFGFSDVGEDPNLMLRCVGAVVSGDASTQALVKLNGTDVREKFDEIRNGLKGAIDFLRANVNVHSLENLPYPTLLVPLCVFFALPDDREMNVTDAQRTAILRWFWRACFTRRYSSGVLRSLKTDIDEMQKLKAGAQNTLGRFAASVAPDFFSENTFITTSVNTRTFVLLLASEGPRSFISGQAVDLRAVLKAYNRNEFHHCFPRAFLAKEGWAATAINALANFAFVSRADNRRLGGKAPSVYRSKMPTDVSAIMERAVLPGRTFDADYQFDEFIKDRALMLAAKAEALIAE